MISNILTTTVTNGLVHLAKSSMKGIQSPKRFSTAVTKDSQRNTYLNADSCLENKYPPKYMKVINGKPKTASVI